MNRNLKAWLLAIATAAFSSVAIAQSYTTFPNVRVSGQLDLQGTLSLNGDTGAMGQIIVNNGMGDMVWANPPATGVTSVGLTMPSGFSVSGSPVTSSGTLNVSTLLDGLIVGTGSGFAQATSADVISLWTGTCDSTTFLRADGQCQPAGGGGDVTAAGNNTFTGINTFTQDVRIQASPAITYGSLALYGMEGTADSARSWISFNDSAGSRIGFIGDSSASNSNLMVYNGVGGDIELVTEGLGSVRVTGPQATMDFRRSGASANSPYIQFSDSIGSRMSYIMSDDGPLDIANERPGHPINLITSGGGIVAVNGGAAEATITSVNDLAVYSNDGAAGAVFRETNADVEAFVGVNGTIGFAGTTSNHPFSLYSNAVPRLTVQPGGTVEVNGSQVCTANGTGCPGGSAGLEGYKVAIGHIATFGGSCSISGAFTDKNLVNCVYNGVGDYTVDLVWSAATLPTCTATLVGLSGGGFGFVSGGAVDANTVRVEVANSSGTPTDGSVSLTCFGD